VPVVESLLHVVIWTPFPSIPGFDP